MLSSFARKSCCKGSRTEAECSSVMSARKHCLILPSPLAHHHHPWANLKPQPTSHVPHAPSAPRLAPTDWEYALFCCLENKPLPPYPPQPPGIAANPPTRSEHSTILPSSENRSQKRPVVLNGGGGRRQLRLSPLVAPPAETAARGLGQPRNGRLVLMRLTGLLVCVLYLPPLTYSRVWVGRVNPTANPPAWDRGGGGRVNGGCL